MNRLKQIINEEISAIRKDKDKEIFNYKGIANNAWRKKVDAAQDFQKINFDLENDDSTGQKKTLYLTKNLRKDQPVKYEINAELFEAGGDWECPVMYFRIELTTQYGLIDVKYQKNPKYIWDFETKYDGLTSCYVMIPPVEAGNKLTKNYEDSSNGSPDKHEWFAYQNDGLSDEDEEKANITDADRTSVWKWLQNTIEKAINDRHEMLDD
jgi:hypothetical protein